MKPIRLISGFLTVGFWTLMSRVLGFAREILILAYIGPGSALDAFVAAFRLPNMFRRFFAEGAFNAAFVPMFAKKYEGDEDAAGFARDAFNLLAVTVLGLAALAMIFMPALVWLTAEGFYGDERFDMTVGFGHIVFPYIVFMSLAALFSGILNATGRFAAAAAAPVLLNVMVVPALIIGAAVRGDVVMWLVWTIPGRRCRPTGPCLDRNPARGHFLSPRPAPRHPRHAANAGDCRSRRAGLGRHADQPRGWPDRRLGHSRCRELALCR